MINAILIHYLTSFPLLARAYTLSKTIKYNFFHLTDRVHDDKHQLKAEKVFKELYYNNIEGNNSYLTKIILLPICSLLFIFLILFCIEKTRCILIFYATYGSATVQSCDNIDKHSNSIPYFCAAELFLNFIENFLFITFIYNLMKYPLKNDIFKIKFEFIVIFTIWAIFHNCVHGYQLFTWDYEEDKNKDKYDILFLINFFQNLLFVTLYSFLTYCRKKVDLNEFKEIVLNFDLFMHNHLCFGFFNEYIKNYYPDFHNYLLFWVDYYIYKQRFFKCYYRNDIEDITRNAYYLYEEYFNFNSSIPAGSNIKLGNYLIEFPIDILESVEEIAFKNFETDIENLRTLYDDAYLFTNNKLYSIYIWMSRDEKEYKKIEKLITYLDVKEIKMKMSIQRKTSV